MGSMVEPKPFASLSSGLLARKGAAKPAMRPQGYGHIGMGPDDLGWNDMGGMAGPGQIPHIYEEEPREHVPSSIAALTPAPRTPGGEPEYENEHEDDDAYSSPVIEQQRAIEASFATDNEELQIEAPVVEPSKVVAMPPRAAQVPQGRKAAFTLRLDAERHLRLRLACAVTNRSAQQLVSQALDDFLARLPEIDALAGQLPARPGKTGRLTE